MASIPYIRTRNPDDGGARPIPAGVDWVHTPAIAIRNPATGIEGAIAVADVDQLVIVEVSNSGDSAAAGALAVQVWACGFGTLGTDFAQTLGGAQGKQVPTPFAIPGGSGGPGQNRVEIPWRPQGAEIGGSERHFCIRANVYDVNLPADKLGDGNLVAVPVQARHAQHNMTLVATAPMRQSFSFDLATANPDLEQSQEFQLEIVEVLGEFDESELVHLERGAWIERLDAGDGGLALRGTQGKIPVAPAHDRPARRLGLELGEQKGSCLAVEYEPGQQRWVTMRLRFDDVGEGLVHRFDITQRGADGILGAARVMTVAVPEELLDRDGPDDSEY